MTTKTIEDSGKAASHLDAWTMAQSILVGLRKAIKTAEAERQAVVTAHPGNHLAPGLRKQSDLLEILQATKRGLEAELHSHARSNGLSMPRVED